MHRKYIVFVTTNLINDKIYVGKDCANKDTYLGSGVHFKNALKKYGRENFSKKIIEYCENKEHLCEREIHWIAELDARNPLTGYNISLGGEGWNFDHETAVKIAKANCAKMGKEKLCERAQKALKTMGPEGIRKRSEKAQKTLGIEGYRAIMKKSNETLGPEGRSRRSQKAMKSMGPNGLINRAKNRAKNLGHEKLLEIAKRAMETMGETGLHERAVNGWKNMSEEARLERVQRKRGIKYKKYKRKPNKKFHTVCIACGKEFIACKITQTCCSNECRQTLKTK